jgi:hypothetical protein
MLNSSAMQGQTKPPHQLAWPAWKTLGREHRSKIGLHPNQAWYSGRNVVVVAYQSTTRGGYGISEGGIDYFEDALAERRIARCTYRLVDRAGGVVNEKPLADVMAKLREAPVNIGTHGSYWWVDEDFDVSPISRNGTPEWL